MNRNYKNYLYQYLIAIVLMAGIILVTKPPFLFPDNNPNGGGNHSVPSNISLTWKPSNFLGLPLSFDQRSM